jgi:hypothetical protein
VSFLLDLGEDLKNRMIIGNPVRIIERPISESLELAAFGIGTLLLLCDQSIANGLLVFQRQAFHKFNDMHGRCAHGGTFAEFRHIVKPLRQCIKQNHETKERVQAVQKRAGLLLDPAVANGVFTL